MSLHPPVMGWRGPLQINIGSYATESWVSLVDAKDVTVLDSRPEAEVGQRGTDQEGYHPGRRQFGFDFELNILDYPAGSLQRTALDKIFTAYDDPDNAVVHVRCCNKEMPANPESPGSAVVYSHKTMVVTKCELSMPQKDPETYSFSLRPGVFYDTDTTSTFSVVVNRQQTA